MAEMEKGEGSIFGLQDDQFAIGRQIGKGGQAVVFECSRLRSGNKYAVKVIDTTTKMFNRIGEQHLQRELRNMQELYHPRIINLHRAFWEDKQCLIVMDLAGGGDLHTRMENEVAKYGTPFKGLGGSEFASKHVALQLLDGIGYMHEHSIIHRDLKLENVLIVRSYPCLADFDEKPRELLDIKIADLGYSKMVKKEDDLPVSQDPDQPPLMQRVHSAVGSPDFVAPEVLTQDYDHRADFWSFGVMLYAMLCGCWPFKIGGRLDLQQDRHRELVSHIYESPSWKSASDHARALVQGLLTVDPSKRFDIETCLRHPWLTIEGLSEDGQRISRRKSRERTASRTSLSELLTGPCPIVREIHSKAGYAVDNVELELHNGSVQTYGTPGGDQPGHWILRPDEFIVGVMQELRHNYLGNAIVFFTSGGRSIPIEGTNAHRRHRFVAPQGSQIVGLQFENSHLIGIHLERVVESRGAVHQIRGWAGHAVDRVEMALRDGSTRVYGEVGGQEMGPWALDPDEYVMIVEQARRDAFLGNSVIFWTSKRNFIKIIGLQAVQTRRFMALPGRQICGLEFEGSSLVKVATCPDNGDLSMQKLSEVYQTSPQVR